jgi:flap endonuclease-1
MGIRGLNTMIKKMAPEAIVHKNISDYKNTIVAIDCSILIYKFRYASKNENSHILGILNRIKFYIMNDILPVFIFDGIPPEAKKNTLLKRQNAKYKLYLRLDELKEMVPSSEEEFLKINSEIEKINSQIINVKKHHIDECKTMLTYCGIPFLDAPNDAEKYCAFLQRNNLIDFTVTDDTDSLTFGCQSVLRTTIVKDIIEVNLDKILEKFNMSYEMFVDFCVLSGCDYCKTIEKIGPVTAYNNIIKYENLENYFKNNNNPDVNQKDFTEAREIFTKFEYELPDKEFFKLKPSNKPGLLLFLNKNDIKENAIKKIIKILI